MTTFIIMTIAACALISGAGLFMLLAWAVYRSLGRLLLPRN